MGAVVIISEGAMGAYEYFTLNGWVVAFSECFFDEGSDPWEVFVGDPMRPGHIHASFKTLEEAKTYARTHKAPKRARRPQTLADLLK